MNIHQAGACLQSWMDEFLVREAFLSEIKMWMAKWHRPFLHAQLGDRSSINDNYAHLGMIHDIYCHSDHLLLCDWIGFGSSITCQFEWTQRQAAEGTGRWDIMMDIVRCDLEATWPGLDLVRRCSEAAPPPPQIDKRRKSLLPSQRRFAEPWQTEVLAEAYQISKEIADVSWRNLSLKNIFEVIDGESPETAKTG